MGRAGATNSHWPAVGRHLRLSGAHERTALGEMQPLSPQLRSWLARALQLDLRRAFASAPEALAALDEVTAEGTGYVPAPVALETFLSRYIAAVLQPVAAAEIATAPVGTPILVAAAEVPDVMPEPAAETAADEDANRRARHDPQA